MPQPYHAPAQPSPLICIKIRTVILISLYTYIDLIMSTATRVAVCILAALQTEAYIRDVLRCDIDVRSSSSAAGSRCAIEWRRSPLMTRRPPPLWWVRWSTRCGTGCPFLLRAVFSPFLPFEQRFPFRWWCPLLPFLKTQTTQVLSTSFLLHAEGVLSFPFSHTQK